MSAVAAEEPSASADTDANEGIVDRFLFLTGRDGRESSEAIATLFPCLVVYLLVRDALGYIQDRHLVDFIVAVGLSAVLASIWLDEPSNVARVLVLVLLGVDVIVSFPGGANHFYLEVIIMAVFALCDVRKAPDREAALVALRWLGIIVMFYSGLKKVLFETYFRGQFLATRMDHPGFSFVFKPLLGEEEFQRLVYLSSSEAPGPYVFTSIPALIVSNSVYVAELLVALLLLIPKTRMGGALLGLAVVVGIEVVARELLFGVLCSYLLMLFLPSAWSKLWFRFSAVVVVGLIPLQLVVGPTVRFFN